MQIVGRTAFNGHYKAKNRAVMALQPSNVTTKEVYTHTLTDLTVRLHDQSFIRPNTPLKLHVVVRRKADDASKPTSNGYGVIDGLERNVLGEDLVEFKRIITAPGDTIMVICNSPVTLFTRSEHIYDPYVIKAGVLETGSSSKYDTPIYVANDPLISHVDGYLSFNRMFAGASSLAQVWNYNIVDLGKKSLDNQYGLGYIAVKRSLGVKNRITLLKDEELHVNTGATIRFCLYGLVMSTVKNSRLGE